MEPFLKQVADHYFGLGEIGRRCFIFPNRRSMVFFRKYLSEALCRKANAAGDGSVTPIIAPECYTINDFFYTASGFAVTDRVTLLLELYRVYSGLYKKAESLDDFIFWGDIILGDFNDIDKYLVDPGQLFRNVSDFKEIQDTYSYLTDLQREAIEAFVSNFRDKAGRLTVDIGSDNPNVKERFLQIWNLLHPIYKEFNRVLEEKGMAYEGMVYRRFAELVSGKAALEGEDGNAFEEGLKARFRAEDGFVFVGLNALNECEKTVLRRMRDAGLAEFCWDYCGDLISDPANKSSFFMSENIREFPSAFQVEAPCRAKFHVLAVPSSVGQVKQVPGILREIADGQVGGDLSLVGRLGGTALEAPTPGSLFAAIDAPVTGVDCAVVLPDEQLLVPLLNSIPPEIREVNVTMGYPMSGSELFSFMSMVAMIQLHTVQRDGKWYFYHKQVWDLFSTGIFRKSRDKQAEDIVRKIKKEAKYYIPIEEFKGSPLLETVFRPVLTDAKAADPQQIRAFAAYLVQVIRTVAPHMADNPDLALELEFAKEYFRSVNMLAPMELAVQPLTFVHLLNQLLSAVSVPFKGEPLKGLQVMGPLETRALDFTNLVILSSNEGMFPRKSISSSFIPPELRKGFGLPTYEFQDAVWAYYFYRMITRAKEVWMVYDSRTEGMNSGEESRYIKQLRYHFNIELDMRTVKTGAMEATELPDIRKTEGDVELIRKKPLSASALQHYLDCPAKFYYADVRRLKPDEEVKEVVDNGIFGTVFHDTMASLYLGEAAMDPAFDMEDKEQMRTIQPMKRVSRAYLRKWIGQKDALRAKVRALIMQMLHVIELSGRNLVVVDVVVEYVVQTLKRDLEQLETRGEDSFELLGIEKHETMVFHGQPFHGFIDRMDRFGDGILRIVDYKTGHVSDDDEFIDDKKAAKIVEKIFKEDVADRPKIALQFFIYDKLMERQAGKQGISNSVYCVSRLFKGAPETFAQNQVFKGLMENKLAALVDELHDLAVPFRRAKVKETQAQRSPCDYCDFKIICGR